MQGLATSPPQRVMRMSSSTAVMISATRDLRGRPAEAIAAGASARALNEPGAAQLQEQLLEIGERDLLALGNGGQRQCAFAPYLARSAIAVTAYRPLVFNSTTLSNLRQLGTYRAPHAALALDTPSRAMRPPGTVRPERSLAVFRTVLNSTGYMEIPSTQVKYFCGSLRPGRHAYASGDAAARQPNQNKREQHTHA